MNMVRLPVAVLLFLATWEASARLDDAWREGAPLLGRYDQSVLLTTDEFGVTGRPNAHYAKWRLNSLGFRGSELRRGRRRIICIGASETFGLYEPEGLEFPRQLERELNIHADREAFQVVNAGLPGQSLSSFGRRAAKVMQEVEPSIAVLYPSLAIYIDPPPREFTKARGTDPPGFQLRIAGKLGALLGGHVPQAVETAVYRLKIARQSADRTVPNRIPDANVVRFRGDLERLLDLLEAAHVKTLLVTHATRFGSAVSEEDRHFMTAWRTLYPKLQEEGFLDMEARLNQVIRAEAAQRNLLLVDAARWLYGRDNFVEYVHFTPRGAGALAHAIADTIDRSELAQARAQ